ncbi:helix-turn-helix domain-containing protein [Paraburkholderia aspalathi]|uniref:helix-turn-helix domain-containing protein n=1 Tax=Paraburkholderia aspalathi TaxID=1324617 RepID=UPI0038BE05E1
MSKRDPLGLSGPFLDSFNIRELAAQTGVTPRHVRYLVRLGLVSPPLRAQGSGEYGNEHVAQIRRTQRLSEEGWAIVEQAELISTRTYWSRTNPQQGRKEVRRKRLVHRFSVGITLDVVVSCATESTPLMKRLVQKMNEAGQRELKAQKSMASRLSRRRGPAVSE